MNQFFSCLDPNINCFGGQLHMLDFYKLTPEEFETLCYKYICALYQKQNYGVEHTRYIHDGGRDIEITFYDELSHFKIWAECKQHKRNIGLDDIAKNVVLVISKHVNKVIFFSASEITEGAEIEISRIADKLNFEVSFLCGERLSCELATQPALVQDYFGVSVVSAISDTEGLVVNCSISEFESDTILSAQEGRSPVFMRDGDLFNIYVHLSNHTLKPFHNILIETISVPYAIKMYDTAIGHEWLARQSDFIAHFRGEIISKQTTIIELPQIVVSYFDSSKIRKQKTINLPCLDISMCKHYPLVGKEITEFLANNIGNALEWCSRHYPQIIDIRGISGSGKSRLADEVQKTAARQGLHTIYLNSADYIDFDLIRKLLCELLHLPFYHGKVDFSRDDILELIKAHGGSEIFAAKIAKFMECGKWEKSDSYYMVESVAHFILVPFRETGYCITIDNSQWLHPEILRFLVRLTEVLTQNNGQTILIIVSNIERKPTFSRKDFQSFLNYFTEKAQVHNHSFTQYMCKPLSEDDATLLLMHLFQIKSQSDPLLKQLLQKSGRLPFELVMTLEYLSDMKIIEWQDAKEWNIRDSKKFSAFLTNGFPANVSILHKRQEAWKQNHTKSENEKFTEVLATIVCFDGILPYSYVTDCNLDQALIEKMEWLLWLAPSQYGQGITFFHDNIKEFCGAHPQYRKNAKVLKKVLRWLRENPETDVPHREKIEFSCLYHLNRFREALTFALDVLILHADILGHTDIVYISQTLYEDPRTQENPANFISIASIYANAIFSLENKELGCRVYSDIVGRIGKDSSIIGLTASCKTIHQAINSQLQSARYDTAIEWLQILENLPDLPLEYQFIAKNRYGVAYIALGQFESAKRCLDDAMRLAKKSMNNLYWMSTAHSDIALYYFYNWRLLGKKASSIRIINEFEAAISDYQAFGKSDTSRDIEMAWHKAFINILKGNYQTATDDAEDCINLSRLNHQAYGLSRGYNLRALAYLKNGDPETAQDCLEEGLHACEMYSFPSGVFRMYNNLGVIFCQNEDYIKASKFFLLALDSLDQPLEYKQFPVLTNLLQIAMHLKDDCLLQKIQKCCDEISSEELLRYRRTIRPYTLLQNSAAESFSFFGFSGISYIF